LETNIFLRTDRVTSSTYTDHPIPPPLGSTAEDFKDLGFGAEVARGTRRHLVNRDGSFNVVRKGLNPFSALSLFHWSPHISWLKFFGFIAASCVAVNALFATIGYGNIIPVGVAANTLITIAALLNIVGIALATGVVFARFSRPTACIIYSRNAIVAPYRDIAALEFRIANESCTRERPTERMRYFGTPVLRASSFERKPRARSEWMLGEFTMSNRTTRGFRRREVS